MRKLLMSTCLSAFMLAGCSTTSGITSTIQQIQAATQALCAFLPTVVTIGELIPGVNVYVGTAGAIAQQICAAVAAQTPPLTRRRLAARQTPLSVVVTMPNGATGYVTGYFVR